jgi:hypothetical protein
MDVSTLLAAFVLGVATTQVYERYRKTREIAWSSVTMGLVFIVVGVVSVTGT